MAGLLAIKKYHESRGEGYRNICLIPTSAHGTNPATAVMCGMKCIPILCDKQGLLDIKDLAAKLEKHGKNVACAMITYPSTHGVFESKIKELTAMIHDHGG